jgi:acyl dehydratase
MGEILMEPRSLNVGDTLPSFSREGTVHHWNRFAAVNDEFAAHHWDDDVARHEGFPAPFAMAPLLHAYLHAMLRGWAGPAARIAAVGIRLRSPFLKGHTMTAGGTVTAVHEESGEIVAELELWMDDDTGARLSTGTASVALPV